MFVSDHSVFEKQALQGVCAPSDYGQNVSAALNLLPSSPYNIYKTFPSAATNKPICYSVQLGF
jgi:hypothetical protein